ncbi:MAG: hypothetical protein ACYC0V_10070 [Armatimonadota bacterium]
MVCSWCRKRHTYTVRRRQDVDWPFPSVWARVLFRFGSKIICPAKRNSETPWSKMLRKWLTSIRQIVETVFDKLHNTFRLKLERPHGLTGFNTRLAAKMALYNYI